VFHVSLPLSFQICFRIFDEFIYAWEDTQVTHNEKAVRLFRMRWAGHVAHMGEGRSAYRILVGRPEGRNHLEDPGIDGRIILKWIFKKWDGGHGLD
jgi:hypothetical protein